MKKAEAQLEELQLKLPENKVEDTKSKAPSESPVSVPFTFLRNLQSPALDQT